MSAAWLCNGYSDPQESYQVSRRKISGRHRRASRRTPTQRRSPTAPPTLPQLRQPQFPYRDKTSALKSMLPKQLCRVPLFVFNVTSSEGSSPVVLGHPLILGKEHAGVHPHGVGATETEPRLRFELLLRERPPHAPILVRVVGRQGSGHGRRHHEAQEDPFRDHRGRRGVQAHKFITINRGGCTRFINCPEETSRWTLVENNMHLRLFGVILFNSCMINIKSELFLNWPNSIIHMPSSTRLRGRIVLRIGFD